MLPKVRSPEVRRANRSPRETHSHANGMGCNWPDAFRLRAARSLTAVHRGIRGIDLPFFHNAYSLLSLPYCLTWCATSGASSTRSASYARNSSDFDALSEQLRIFAISA